MKAEILKALNWRYAVSTFDSTKKVSADDLKTILESARLAPSAFGIEAWKFLVIRNSDLREELKAAGFGQSKITEASDLIVICYRTDTEGKLADERVARTAEIQNQAIEELEGLKKAINGSMKMKLEHGILESWVRAQSYIPLGMMIETAALLGVDSAAMEGFDPIKVNEILGLSEKNLHAATMLAIGYRGEDGAANRKKVRRAYEEVVEFID